MMGGSKVPFNASEYILTQHEMLNESIYTKVFQSGLTVKVLPKSGYRKKHASLAIGYGSLDQVFETGGQVLEVPEGIAHYLEHTLFEKEYSNVFNRFSQLGASANAYTSYYLTNYLFNAVDCFSECLDILLDFVQTPYFSEKTVEKERGIIEQELKMYHDMPDRMLLMNLAEAMYSEHPVKVDIVGTQESIRRITPDTLRQCYHTFYHPGNMVLLVVGEVNPEEIFEQVQIDQSKRSHPQGATTKRHYPDEPDEVRTALIRRKMMASTARVAVGFKDKVEEIDLPPMESYRLQLLTGIVLKALTGRSSKLYNRLYNEGLINDSFWSYYDLGPGYGYTVLGGESPEPDRLVEELQKGIEELAYQQIQPEDFERLKRASQGRYISGFNNLEGLASTFISLYFKGISYFDTSDVLQSLSCEEANLRLKNHFRPQRMSVSIIDRN
jgi:predicted Zn-dependent peptidase